MRSAESTALPTPIPFDRFSVQDVFTAFARADCPSAVWNKTSPSPVRDQPGLGDRWVFEIPRIAPAGGQVIVFDSQAQRAEWEAYIAELRNDDETRRDVVYTYFHENLMLQLNAGLTNQEAGVYRDALLGLQ
ncbi:MAG: hypothetical protein IPK19_12895 [Chloroflexi bacterium]|nr:hypothetical protein [Chloroflexota bacterium]